MWLFQYVNTAYQIFSALNCIVDHLMRAVSASCTMRKIIEQSGPGSNEGAVLLVEGPHSSDICDDGTHAKEICFQLDRTFLQDFRTLNGYCNNKETPVLGSKGSRLSRLLPAEHMKVEKPTYFEKPQLNGMFNYFMVMDFIHRCSLL